MTAVIQNLTMEQGATFQKHLTWRDKNKRPINLTGYRAHFQVRAVLGGPVLCDATTENGGITLGGANGTIDIRISAASTATLNFTSGFYELRLIIADVPNDPTGIRLMQGKMMLSLAVIAGA